MEIDADIQRCIRKHIKCIKVIREEITIFVFLSTRRGVATPILWLIDNNIWCDSEEGADIYSKSRLSPEARTRHHRTTIHKPGKFATHETDKIKNSHKIVLG